MYSLLIKSLFKYTEVAIRIVIGEGLAGCTDRWGMKYSILPIKVKNNAKVMEKIIPLHTVAKRGVRKGVFIFILLFFPERREKSNNYSK